MNPDILKKILEAFLNVYFVDIGGTCWTPSLVNGFEL
jgi:hypothetical protein